MNRFGEQMAKRRRRKGRSSEQGSIVYTVGFSYQNTIGLARGWVNPNVALGDMNEFVRRVAIRQLHLITHSHCTKLFFLPEGLLVLLSLTMAL